MNELSNKMQTPQGDDIGQEEQQPLAASTTNQQGAPEGTYQQGLPPVEGGYPQYTPTWRLSAIWIPIIIPQDQQQYGYQQQQQQQYSTQYMGDAGPYDGDITGHEGENRWPVMLPLRMGIRVDLFRSRGKTIFVRFHAMQSLLFFGILGILEGIFSYLPLFGPIGWALGLVMFIGWIVMMVKALGASIRSCRCLVILLRG